MSANDKSKEKPAKPFYAILGDDFLPHIIYEPDFERERVDGMGQPSIEKDKKIIKEIYEEQVGRPSLIGDDDTHEVEFFKRLNIENHTNISTIKRIIEKDEVPLGKDYYAVVSLVSGAEPTHISFLTTDDYVNTSVATIPEIPGKKLFKIVITATTQPVKFSLNNHKSQKKLITTIAAGSSMTYESKVGVFEGITLQATGGNATATVYGFY